jgi:hypothetical protein
VTHASSQQASARTKPMTPKPDKANESASTPARPKTPAAAGNRRATISKAATQQAAPARIATQLSHRLDLGFDVLMVNPLRTEDDAGHEDQVLEILGGL